MRGRAELPVRPAARVGSDGPGLRLSRRESWSAGRGRRGSVRAVAVRGWREGVGPLPRRDVHFALEMCVLHSRMTVGTALSSAKCTSRRPGAPRGDGRAVAAVRWRLRRTLPWARPADRGAPPGARGGAVCPNLLQRPPSHRSAGGESLIFRASSRGRSRRGAPLQQIWTTARPGPPQEPHPHHPRARPPPSPRRKYSTGSWRRSPVRTTCVPLDHRGPTAHEWSKENAATNPLNNLPDAAPPSSPGPCAGRMGRGARTGPFNSGPRRSAHRHRPRRLEAGGSARPRLRRRR